MLSVTLKDCEVQTFRSGGKGGQNQNKRDTGVRIIHRPSGARGESREHRSQEQNKRAAFTRMAKSGSFRVWLNRELLADEEKQRLERKYSTGSENLQVEVRDGLRWVPETT